MKQLKFRIQKVEMSRLLKKFTIVHVVLKHNKCQGNIVIGYIVNLRKKCIMNYNS